MTPKRPESVLVVLYNHQQQVLVLRRNDNDQFWQSVTGSLENNETPVETAVREVQEETGIDLHFVTQKKKHNVTQVERPNNNNTVIDCRLVNQYQILKKWRARYAAGVTRNVEYVFCAQVAVDEKITLSEHSTFLWLPKQAAINKVSSVTNKLAIEKFVPEEITCK